jgi:hemin uptake protein HemP
LTVPVLIESMPQNANRPPPGRGSQPPRRPPREIDVAELVQDAGEVVLRHNGERYRLRVTANSKLILTK